MQLHIALFYNVGLEETRLKDSGSWLKCNGKKLQVLSGDRMGGMYQIMRAAVTNTTDLVA